MVAEIRPDAPERHVAVPATALAKERLNNVLFANMIMLGALTRLGDMAYDAMKTAMLDVIPRFHEQNVAALELGYALPALVSHQPA
jgi:Pyruvate/2-oxoacid:ferredoxin oxidoreductase gamma subunit